MPRLQGAGQHSECPREHAVRSSEGRWPRIYARFSTISVHAQCGEGARCPHVL